jgi:glycosyltransferase involved in cell wall biosynthesis
MQKPSISIIIPVYNGSKTIDKCVSSLKAQTLKQCEFIFVDDCSTDDTVEKLTSLTQNDNRFIILRQEKHFDPFQSRKRGIATSTGEYIMFLDADDTFIPKACEKAYKIITRKNVDLFLFGSNAVQTEASSKKAIKGYRQYLRFENKIRGLYRTKEECRELYFKESGFGFSTSLAKKIFKAEILKQAMNELNPMLYLGYGQDLYQLIATMPYISSIYADNHYVLHNYFIGEGATQLGQNNISIEKYKRLVSSANTYIEIENFLRNANLSDLDKSNALTCAKKGLLISAQKHLWCLSDENLAQGFAMLREAWKCDYLKNLPLNENLQRVNSFVLESIALSQEIKEEIRMAISNQRGRISMVTPLVSIIIPVYNVEKYLRECLDSVINQTMSSIEIICVDDGSTDSSADILKEYSTRDNRITIITKENGGLSSARNAGMEVARGEYLTFLDSDDYLEKDAIQQLYNKATSKQLDVLLFCGKSFCENGFSNNVAGNYSACPSLLTKTVSGINFFISSFKCNNHVGTAPLKLFRTAFLKENNIRFIEGILHEDEPFYYETILAAKHVAKTPEQFYMRRYHADSITTCSKSSKHVIGKLTGISRILELAKTNQLTGAALEVTMEFISAMANNIASDYYSLNEEELNKLNSLNLDGKHFLQLLLGLTNGRRLAIVEQSFSFKLGMALTKPIRWVYEIFHK